MTLTDILGKIAEKSIYANGRHVDAANAMAQELSRKNLDYKFAIIHFTGSNYGNGIMSNKYGSTKYISDNGHHVGINYKGRVICNIHPNGLVLNAWFNDFSGLGVKYNVLASSYKSRTQIIALIAANQVFPNVINNLP